MVHGAHREANVKSSAGAPYPTEDSSAKVYHKSYPYRLRNFSVRFLIGSWYLHYYGLGVNQKATMQTVHHRFVPSLVPSTFPHCIEWQSYQNESSMVMFLTAMPCVHSSVHINVDTYL